VFRGSLLPRSNLDVCNYLIAMYAWQLLAPVLGVMCILFSGFILTRTKIDGWFIWIYYLSPFSWAIRSWGIVEFTSQSYPVCV
jgi:ABC-type multidrug transport system permease subunit